VWTGLVHLSIPPKYLPGRFGRIITVVFRNLFSRQNALTGAPAVRRIKTYSAQSGFVYRYYYQGHRPFRQGGAAATEFVFGVSADRRAWGPVGIRIAASAVAAWEKSHQRELSVTEVYALAKMALFQAFDEQSNPAHMRGAAAVSEADIEAIASTLGFE